MMATALLIFAKPPALAKRRLAADLGRRTATRIAAALLDDALARGAASPLQPRYFYWSGSLADAEALRAEKSGYRLAIQAGPDLGARMHQAFAETLAGHEAALLIGTDCPALDAARLAHAAALLEANDAVLVPAHDGGYVAIGLARRTLPVLATLFHGIAWGSAAVAEHTRTRLRRAGLSVGEAAPLADIDNGRDVARAAPRHPFLAVAGGKKYATLARMQQQRQK